MDFALNYASDQPKFAGVLNDTKKEKNHLHLILLIPHMDHVVKEILFEHNKFTVVSLIM